MSDNGLGRKIRQVLSTYPEPTADNRKWDQKEALTEIRAIINNKVGETYRVTVSRTQPLPYIPAVGVSHLQAGRGMSRGLSVVLLFDVVSNRVCLALSQGTKDAEQRVERVSEGFSEEIVCDKIQNHLERQAKRFREKLEENYNEELRNRGFNMNRLYFDKSLQSPSNNLYGISVITNKTYPQEKLSTSGILIEDLISLVNRYGRLVERGTYEEIIHSDPSYSIFWYETTPHQPSEAAEARIARVEHIENETVQLEAYEVGTDTTESYLRHIGTGFASEEEIPEEWQSSVALSIVPPSQSDVPIQSEFGNKVVGITRNYEVEETVEVTVKNLLSQYGMTQRSL